MEGVVVVVNVVVISYVSIILTGIKDVSGRTALDYAKNAELKEIIRTYPRTVTPLMRLMRRQQVQKINKKLILF